MAFRSFEDEKRRKWNRETITWLREWTGGPLMKLTIVLQNSGMVLFFLVVTMCNVYAVKLKVKFTLELATKAQKGSRGIALLFL
jgi:hypothetical protein